MSAENKSYQTHQKDVVLIVLVHILGMDHANIRNIQRIAGGDPDQKICLLLDHAGRQGQEVADPWYTDDFDAAWGDVRVR